MAEGGALPFGLGALAAAVPLGALALALWRRGRRRVWELSRFRDAVENSAMGVAVFDRDDRYLYVNPAYSEITGAQPEQVLGIRLQSRSAVFEDPELLARVLPRIHEGSGWQGQSRLRSAGDPPGTWRDLAFTVSPILDRGRFAGYVTTALDVTAEAEARRELEARTAELAAARDRLQQDLLEREQAAREKDLLQRELRRSQTLEAVGHLAGGVAHDFNNILGSIIGCLYPVEQRVAGDPDAQREIAAIKELCKRGGDLNRQLLAVGRRDTGPREPVECGPFLDNLGMVLRRTLPPTVEVAVHAPPSLPAVRGNRGTLLAAFLNLGLNARDAMPDGGRLTLRARVEADRDGRSAVCIEVEDTGIGIPAELQEKVFEPFYTTKSPGVGTGLGLATAQAAVEECGGSIQLRSAPGEGSCFTVRLPVLERRLRRRPAAPPAVHPATAAPVLVVEDEAGIARLMRRTLEGAGYAVVVAADGAAALARLRDPAPLGAVTLDLMLPEVGGAEVLAELQRTRPEVPVLVVTARDDLARDVSAALPRLVKPFTVTELLDALAALLGAPADAGGSDG